jgi:hypothetical protein
MALLYSNSRKGNDLRMLPSFLTLLAIIIPCFVVSLRDSGRDAITEDATVLSRPFVCVSRNLPGAQWVCALFQLFLSLRFLEIRLRACVLLFCFFLSFFLSLMCVCVCVCVFVCVRLYPGKQAMGPTLTSRKKTEIDEF